MDKYAYAKKVLQGGKTIVIDTKLMHGLGFYSTRDFFYDLGQWGYTADFGRFSMATDDHVQSYLRAFLKDTFIDD